MILFFLVMPVLAEAGQVIGKITRLKGSVLIYRDGARIGMGATNGMDLQQNDRIKTRAKAYIRFQLSDGSIMTLGQKAELTLDTFTYDPNKKKRVAFFKVAVGKLRVFASRMMKYRDNRFQVQTPTAVAGVRGTVFMVWVESPTVTRVACFDSAVEVASVFKPDEFVVLTKNILTSVEKGAPPAQPVLMTEDQFKQFQTGFEGDIKPTDEESGFRDEKGDDEEGREEGDEQGEAPDPTLPDETGDDQPPPEPPQFDEPPEFEPEDIDELVDEVVEDVIDDQPTVEPETDPEPTVLPEPPAVPAAN